MTWFIESPWPALALGFSLQVILAMALARTGRAAIIPVMVLALAATVGLLALERVVVTEREEVEDALDAVADALESNDVPAVLAAFSPDCPRLGEVKSALARFTVREAHVGGDLEVRINRLTNPPSAATYFTGRIDGRDARGEFPYEHMIRKFKVTLHRRGGKWLIADYSDADSRAR